MRSALKLFLLTIFCLTLTNCALFSGGDEKDSENTEDYPKYENYSSSDIYKDIEGEGRDVSSEDYSDDDYGDAGSDDEGDSQDDELILSSGDGEEEENTPSAAMASVQEDPLPVEKVEKPKKKKRKKKRSSKKFKAGMYRMGIDCNMRKTASANSKKMGTVKKGKKLWVDAHNADWVKVYKKNGAVFINKGCL